MLNLGLKIAILVPMRCMQNIKNIDKRIQQWELKCQSTVELVFTPIKPRDRENLGNLLEKKNLIT